MTKKLLEVAHDTVKGLHKIGLVDKLTMHEFDAMCLPPIKKFSAKEIKQLRIKQKVSQPIMAQILNVSPSTIKHWEIGDKHPNGAALKLLNLIAEKGVAILI
jgi:putative transcriptional regulator